MVNRVDIVALLWLDAVGFMLLAVSTPNRVAFIDLIPVFLFAIAMVLYAVGCE